MNWERCKEYGLVEINPVNGDIRLYYNQFSYMLAGNPIWFTPEAATWQGNNLIVRGYDQYGKQRAVVMDGFNSYRQVI